MNVELIDSVVLRERLRLGVDVVRAHRVAAGQPLQADQVRRVRELIETRVKLALCHMDDDQLRFNWSWEQAAERLSFEVAMGIAREYRDRWAEF